MSLLAVLPNGESKTVEQRLVTEGFESERCGHDCYYHKLSKHLVRDGASGAAKMSLLGPTWGREALWVTEAESNSK